MKYFPIKQLQSINRKANPTLLGNTEGHDGLLRDTENVINSLIGSLRKTTDYEQVGTQVVVSSASQSPSASASPSSSASPSASDSPSPSPPSASASPSASQSPSSSASPSSEPAGFDVLGIGEFIRGGSSAGTYEPYIAVEGTGTAKLYKLVGSTWTVQSPTLTAGVRTKFASIPQLDVFFAVNKTDGLLENNAGTWGGSTHNSGAPKAASMNFLKDTRLYLGDCVVSGTPKPATVYYSTRAAEGNLAWDTDVQTLVLPEPFTAFGMAGEDQLIFTPNMVFRGDATQLKQISDIGAINQDVVKWKRGWCYFANDEGVFATNGGEPQKISNPIDDWFENISDLTVMRAGVVGNFYCLYLGTVTIDGQSKDNVWAFFDVTQNSFHRATTLEPAKEIGTVRLNGRKRLLFGNDHAEVFKMFSGESQNGLAYTSSFETDYIYLGNVDTTILALRVYGRNMPGIQVQYKLSDQRQWMGDNLALHGDIAEVGLSEMSEKIKFRFTETSKGPFYDIHRIEIGIEDHDQYREKDE